MESKNTSAVPRLENSKNIEIEIDDITKIKFTYNNKIIIFNITQKLIPPKYYQLNVTLEQLYKYNKYFLNFESTQELVVGLSKSIKEKNQILNMIIKIIINVLSLF